LISPTDAASQFLQKLEIHVSIVDQDTSDQDDVASLEEIDIVIHESNPNKVFVTLSVNDKEEHFQLDTGATVNVMSEITLSYRLYNMEIITKQIVWKC